MDENIVKKFSKECIKEYEVVRRSGRANMYSYHDVIRTTWELDCDILKNVSRADYPIFLKNMGALMEHYYGIKE